MDSVREKFKNDDFSAVIKQALPPMAKLYATVAREKAGTGMYIGGHDTPSYPDFMVGAFIEWIRCARGDAVVEHVIHEVEEGVLERLMNCLQPMLR